MVVPYATDSRTGQLGPYPETRAALTRDGVDARYVSVNGDPTAYHELMSGLWREGHGFIVCEHDIVPWPGAIAVLQACGHDWCGFAYEISTGVGLPGMLGLTRFSDRLVGDHSGVFHAIAALPPDGTPRGYWGRLDTRLKQVLEADGQRFVVHWPAVDHLNPAQGLRVHYNCPTCGAGIPREATLAGPPPYTCPREDHHADRAVAAHR